MKLQSVAKTHTGKVREKNQDALLERAEVGVFIVADGMGGEQAGEEASAQVIATAGAAIEAFFKKTPGGASQVEGMMRDTLLEANQDVFQISVREPHKRGLGSTCSMLCLHRGVYFVAQVGDSRIYAARRGEVRQLTRDHTLVWALYEQGAITRDQLETHPERHLLTQCIGSPRPIKVDTLEGALEPGDTFLICSDGLTGYAEEKKVFEILKNDRWTLEERADRMIDAALDAGGGDNVSVILVRVEALEEQDSWKPEATAPPHRLEATAESAIMDAEAQLGATFRRGAAPPDHTRRNLAVGAGALVMLAIIGMFALAARPFKVYLQPIEPSETETLGELTVQAARAREPARTFQPQRDEQGYFVTLPKAGGYKLTVGRSGYVAKEFTLDVDSRAGSRISVAPWVAVARLELQLPDEPKATALRMVREDVEGKPGWERSIDPQELTPGKTLRDELEPGILYTVVIQAPGHADFVGRYQLAPGERRTVKVYFN